ncbi:uroporphyrinogen-III synthase [Pseudoalteromonas citrea]|uniref:Uroporphyrinogen-III synthase n=1 Tax=Pseudoalteromonas citrea TaxID=43655 RepID=A0A5S3XKC3_9GAMM|nr:uroporphyrinogen-III C-methyltransferase [Pseudoalteromonas citrea]TMP43799.1 uroporphyrinogen-III synthase [Pseudoalteromonas citrea]TMP55349.1 uroporphyrinogen-III synthase [Pseudoalteromonas citrea]
MAIAITRPEGKGEQLAELLTAQQIDIVKTPVLKLEMLPVNNTQLSPIDDADLIIFISQDAVKGLAAHLPQLPSTATLVAVGEQTAKAIDTVYARQAQTPVQQDSEGVLALPQLQSIANKQVVIVKGEGGRTLLAKTLKARGAVLNQCLVYRRTPVLAQSDTWLDHWREAKIDGIVITSNAAIDAIFNTTNKELLAWLNQCHFYLVSQRSADHLMRQHQVASSHITVASGPNDEAIFKCIMPEQTQQGSQMSEQQNQQNETHAVEGKPVKQKISKVGVLALLVALAGGTATAGLIIHGQQISDKTYLALAQLQQQNSQLSEQLNTTREQLVQLQNQQKQVDMQIESRLAAQTQQFDTQLQAALSSAQQQVSGALSSEVLYLQRMAQFKASAEQDFQGSIAVLQRLSDVLQHEPNTTGVLSAIAQDIALLNAQAKPHLESRYLQLHGLLAQVPELELQTLRLPEQTAAPTAQLSSDVSDWQANLLRTWENLVDDFITIRHREVAVIDPLLDKQEQQLLKAQLRSHLSQAQSALMDKQASVFFSALSSAQQTLTSYFKMDSAAVQSMHDELVLMQGQSLAFNQTVQLRSAKAVQGWLK